MLAAAENSSIRYYLLETYYLRNGDQGSRLAEWLREGLLPACARLKVPGPRFVLEGLVAAHMPQVACLTPYASLEEMTVSRAKLRADASCRAAFEKWEAGAEAPYEEYAEHLLETTSYCPPPPADTPADQKPRVFELRLYHSPTERQLKALHERFAGPEIKIFHRVGVHPVLYSSTAVGPHKPNLVYLTPFADLAAREKAWAAFGADPEWIKVRKESIERSGQISSVIQISLYRAAAYSPVR